MKTPSSVELSLAEH